MLPKPKNIKRTTSAPSRPVVFFLALAYILMALGDGVRMGFWWVIRLIIVSYKKISLQSRPVKILVTTIRMRMRVAISVRKLFLRQWIQRVIPSTKPKKYARKNRRWNDILPKFSLPQFIGLHPLMVFILGSLSTIFFIAIPLIAYLWLRSLPNPTLLTVRDLDVTTKVFDRNGALLYEIYADQNRTPLALSDIPKYVIQATIAIEDKNFYSHQGFSLSGMARAARETMLKGRVQGGSTITQQLIKSALLTPEINVSRKIKEIILAFWAERLYTKNQLLEMYLNQVPYGGTAWGIESAAQTYFSKSAKNLTLAEASLLAGLPAAPSEYSPFGTHVDRAFSRQGEVLRRMVEDRYITESQAREALAQEIRFAKPRIGIRAPHFVMYIKEILERRYGPRLVERGGLRIKTSLDLGLQERVEEIVNTNITKLASLRVGNGAAIVTNPKTGEILAMVGSRDYFDTTREGNVNVTVAHRQPGSSIKVVTYAAAMEKGFTAGSILDDSPVSYPQIGAPAYTPVNYDSKFHGFVPLRYALGNSYNIPAIRTIAAIGVPAVIQKGRAMGITSWIDESRYGLALTLGGGEVTMLDMASVFGTLANLGTRVELLPITEVSDYTGRILEKNKSNERPQAVKPEVAWIIGNILSDNNARTAAFGPNSMLVIPGKTVSVKTGTTDNLRDNWTIGYTPSVVASVWVGNNNNSPMNPYLVSGVTGAAPIWNAIMTDILKDRPDETLPRPDGVISVPCYYGRPEYFLIGTQPTSGQCAPLPTPRPTESPTPTP
ncbi:MAG: transglycosylase domain-containing protein [Candidatus Gottesmanbacteria bacterium]|nr:transglycosylase domain-containing protein [Candidatus Gottesmanbacteria bacterium]